MVAPAIVAAGLTAGGSLLGGMFAGSGQKAGGKMAARATLKANAQNLKYQMKFAKMGIRWKVKDARKAGIAPLAALGAQTTAFSPTFVGATQAGQGVADAAASMGQGISRAATALGDGYDRNAEYVAQLQKLQLDNMTLQNQALSSQIRLMTQPGNPPLAPPAAADRYLIPGQAAGVDYKNSEYVTSEKRYPGVDPGTMNDRAVLSPDGKTQVIVPSKDAKAATEDSTIPEFQMSIRHNAAAIADPRSMWRGPIGRDEDVSYNPFTGELTKFTLPSWVVKAREKLDYETSRSDPYRGRTYGRGTATNSGFHGF